MTASVSSIFGNSGLMNNPGVKSSPASGIFTSGNSDAEQITGVKFGTLTFGNGDTIKNLEDESSCTSGSFTVGTSDVTKNSEVNSSFASGTFSFSNNGPMKNIGDKPFLFSGSFNFDNIGATKNSGAKFSIASVDNASGNSKVIKEQSLKVRKDNSSSAFGKFTSSVGAKKKENMTDNKSTSGFGAFSLGSNSEEEHEGIKKAGCGNSMEDTARLSTPGTKMFLNTQVVEDEPLESESRQAPMERKLQNTIHTFADTQLLTSKSPDRDSQKYEGAGHLQSHRIPTPGELARIISYYPSFSAKISDLETLKGFSSASVSYIASIHRHVFHLYQDLITLEPQVTFCLEHISEKGCQNPSVCKRIHMCPKYINSTCSEKHCYLGHLWHTDHNLLILKNYFVAKLSPLQLSNLFKSLGNTNKLANSLLICSQYNRNLCTKMNCCELHVCLDFVIGIAKCKKDFCFLNHDILNAQCKTILRSKGISTNQAARDVVKALHKAIPSLTEKIKCPSRDQLLAKQPQSVWSHHLQGNVQIPEICYYSVEKQCRNRDGKCPRLHAEHHFHWQVKKEDSWFNFRHKHSLALERSFCDVTQDGVDLKEVDLPVPDDKSVDGLVAYVSLDTWHADFVTMTLRNSSVTKKLLIRRLCTENIPGKVIEASTFCWYFIDPNKVWVRYGDHDTKSHTVSAISSDDIEKHYVENPTNPVVFDASKFRYVLDFKTMKQTNQSTKVSREVRRRPVPHLEGKEEFPAFWNIMPHGKRLLRVALPNSSTEYQKVITLLQGKFSKSQIKKIERIQHPYLWRAFQNKVKEMTAIYGNASRINVCQLFHGTKPDVVENICLENFDWRLHGSNVGEVYGQGTYFSTDAKYSYGYCKADSAGVKFLFIAKVLVGSVITGDSSMTRPPKNFDSTADTDTNFKILVKYDKQEYYPEYVISLT
ncbi:protein mono-ADP-ribosyltransferase PARP12-like [Macrobrachium nipponense]|uniref:protein mono-ADP-ribosyltransferase PARP12-like n=1 Tax=Macrobrachium nipponense TaxID=159736 RepID=UPI0030C7DCB5